MTTQVDSGFPSDVGPPFDYNSVSCLSISLCVEVDDTGNPLRGIIAPPGRR